MPPPSDLTLRRLLQAVMRRPTLSRWLSNDIRVMAWNRLGADIQPRCYVSPRVNICFGHVTVGAGSALLGDAELAAWGPISIGRRVTVSNGVHVLTGGHDVDDPSFAAVVRPVRIGDDVWLAQGAVVLPGVEIGDGAVVGAYAVVTKDVPPRAVVGGNPARLIRMRKSFDSTVVPADLKRKVDAGRPGRRQQSSQIGWNSGVLTVLRKMYADRE